MRRIIGALVFAAVAATPFAASSPYAAHAASPRAKSMSVMLHVTKAFKHRAMFMHAMASGKIKMAGHDATVSVTTENLPMPAIVGEHAYAVFATDGAMSERVGFLHMNGHMGAVKGMVMMSRITDIDIWAVASMSEKHPMGKKVFSGMVM
jgi:hypothetical protein